MTRRTKNDGMEYDHKLYKWNICPNCAGAVILFADGTNQAHCMKCGPVTYVSMMETDVPLYREAVRNVAETHTTGEISANWGAVSDAYKAGQPCINDGVSSPAWWDEIKPIQF